MTPQPRSPLAKLDGHQLLFLPPQLAMAPHSLALILWLTLVALKLLQWHQRWRERSGAALSRAFQEELLRRRQLRTPH